MADYDELSSNLTTKNFLLIFVATLGLVFVAVMTFVLLNDGHTVESEFSESTLYILQDYVYVFLIFASIYILGMRVSKLSLVDLGFRRCSFDWLVRAFLAGIMMYSIRILSDNLVYDFSGFRRMLEPGQTDRAILRDASSLAVIAFILVVTILTPLATEIFQRGILFVWLRRNFNFMMSAIVSSVIFGVFHIELVRYAQVLIFGTLAAYFYEKSRSLWPSIVFHATIGCAYTLGLVPMARLP